jgi:hypothetical protein
MRETLSLTLYDLQQPVILSSQEAVDTWLDTSSEEWSPKLTQLVNPYQDEDVPLEWYVNSGLT